MAACLFYLLGPVLLLLTQGVAAAGQAQNPSKVDPRPPESLPFAKELSPLSEQMADKESRLRAELDKQPQSAQILYELALVLRLERKPQESLRIYTQAASLKKPDPEQLRSVALDYVQLNDYEDAIHWLCVALDMDQNNVDVLYSLGRCYYTQSNFEEALTAFKRVLQLQPDHLKAEENLGLTLDAENEPRPAEQALRLAVQWADERKLKDEWPYIDLGTLLLDQARANEALPFLTRAAEIAPDSPPACEKLGRAMLASGSARKAIAMLGKAAALDSKNPKVHFELGRAYRETGQIEKAKAEFDISKTLYGSHDQN